MFNAGPGRTSAKTRALNVNWRASVAAAGTQGNNRPLALVSPLPGKAPGSKANARAPWATARQTRAGIWSGKSRETSMSTRPLGAFAVSGVSGTGAA